MKIIKSIAQMVFAGFGIAAGVVLAVDAADDVVRAMTAKKGENK